MKRTHYLAVQLEKERVAKKKTPVNPWAVCVLPGTFITLADGKMIPIETIEVGQQVLTHTGVARPVTEIFTREVEETIYQISTENNLKSLKLTQEHPVYTKMKSNHPEDKDVKDGYVELPTFLPAEMVRVGDLVHSPRWVIDNTEYQSVVEHRYLTVTGIKTEFYQGNVHNLAVYKDESYVANSISVHNCHAQLGPEKTKKFEKCVLDIKKKQHQSSRKITLSDSYQIISSGPGGEKETREYTVAGRPRNLDELEKLFRWIESLCSAGHSASAEIWVDGDGAANVRFENLKETKANEFEVNDRSRGPELKIGLD